MKYEEHPFSELLKNIVDNRGRTCPVEESGMPLIATNCIKNESLYPVYEKLRYVSDETYNNWFRGHPESGDIIFVCKGSPGRVAWTPDPVPFCIAQDMVAIRADETKVHPKYLFALLRSQVTQNQILNMHVGTLIPHFKKGDFKNLYLYIPENLEYQEQVGETYFKFCEKIEINNQTNQTLEQIAQAIFKSWFVDFEPVKAKIRAREKWLQNHPDSFAATPPSQGVELTDSPPAKGEYAEGGRGLNNLKHLKTFRTKLRNKLTPAEAKLWTYLKNKQLKGRKFRRQHSVGNYILDFYCPAEKLAIELDGEVHNSETQAVYDQERSLFLAHYGIKVLRFENNIVFENPEGLLSKVQEHFNHPTPDGAPLLEKEGSLEEAMNLAAMSVISGKDEAVLKQLQADRPESYAKLKQTAALFPSAMQESELGEIPEGWVYQIANGIADVAIGKTPPRKESQWFSESPDDIKWISIRDMGESGVYALRTSEYLTEEAINKFNVRCIPDNTVLLSFKLTIGRITITDGEMLSNEAIAHFKLEDGSPVTTEYLYLYLKQFDYSNLGNTSSIATAVNSKTIKNMPILVPLSKVVSAFNGFISPFFINIKTALHENESLINTRDSLLPKLLSGELEVS